MIEVEKQVSSLDKEGKSFRVDFSPDVDWESLPYEVMVDRERIVGMLSEFGLT